VTVRTTYPVAELERRFYAFVLDRLLSWGLVALAGAGAWLALDREGGWALVAVVGGTLALLWLALAVLVGVSGTSPGKSAVGLRVVHRGTGTPIGVGPALLRALVLAVSSLPTFGIGLATLAWTAVEDRGRQRRGWHDHVADSVVVDVRPVPEVAAHVEEAPRHIVNLTAMRLIPAPAVETPPTPTRAPGPEQSMRRQPVPPAPTPATQPLPTPAPAPRADPSDDPGRTVVRSAARNAAPATRWRVAFDTGESFVVEGLALVGRRPEPRAGEAVRHVVPLPSADMSVSKTHAQLAPADDGVLVVMDRGSTNGTVVVRQGVARQLAPGKPATLLDGDRVSFGDRQMTVAREP
jgi:uncharacterized RDD family membrane protein YckC